MDRLICVLLSGCLMVFLLSCSGKNQISAWHASRDYHQNVPAVLNLPEPWEDGMTLNDHMGRPKATLQVWDESKAIFIPDRTIIEGELLQVQISEPVAMASPCRIEETDGKIVAHFNGQEILSYAIEEQLPDDSLPAYYRRSGFIHPLKTSSGQIVTDGFPEGHTHQHGVFNAWTRSHFRGEMIDFWNQQAQLGTVQHQEVLSIENGPVYSSFSVALQPLAFINGDTIPTLAERWTVRIIPLADNYLIDWSIEQKGNGIDTLIIDEYHYGGAAFRGSKYWNTEEGAFDSKVYFTTSDHKSQLDGNHTRPLWAALYGRVPESFAGVAMMGHPSNFRHPQPIRIHPKMPYFCYAPMVLGSFSIAPNATYRSRYAVFVYDGRPQGKDLTQIQTAYSQF